MIAVAVPLLVAQRDEKCAVGPAGQLGLHVGLAAAQHEGPDAGMQLVEVAVTHGAATLVEFVEVAVEAEQRSEHGRIEEGHQRVDLVDAVFDRRAGEDEGVAAAQALDGLRGLGVPVLDPLRFVQDHDVGLQPLVDVQRVGQHLLVIDDGEERRGGIAPEAFPPGAEHELVAEARETLDLLLPFGLERGRRDDQHAGSLAEPVQQRAGGDGLDGLAQPHLVGQQRALGEGQVQHAFALVWVQRHQGFMRRPLAGMHLLLVLARASLRSSIRRLASSHGATSCEMRRWGPPTRRSSSIARSGSSPVTRPLLSSSRLTAGPSRASPPWTRNVPAMWSGTTSIAPGTVGLRPPEGGAVPRLAGRAAPLQRACRSREH